MTNPLHNLKKYARQPFKKSHFSKIDEKLLDITSNFNTSESFNGEASILDSELNDLLDEVSTDIAKANISRYSKEILAPILVPTSGCNTARSNNSSTFQPLSQDYELISKLMKRIKNLELIQRFQEKELKDKNLRIKVLEDKCQLYQKSKEIFNTNADKVNELEMLCEQLQKQISEMETFLADYGLVWVGEESLCDSKNSIEYSWLNDQETELDISKDIEKFIVDYDKILKNIEELNLLVKSDETLVTLTGPERVQLKKKSSVKLTLYANGISLFNGPFRSFEDQSTRSVIKDIIDGYFPSELEDRYPSGVPIQTIDRRNIFYDAKQIKVFQGIGKTLGGLSTSSKLLNNYMQNKHSNQYTQPFTEIISKDLESQMTMEQFLNKLPTATINSEGKILSIRNSIREIIENKTSTARQSTASNTARQPEIPPDPKPTSNTNPEHETHIKIRSLNGDQLHYIVMDANQSVRNLYEKLSQLINISIDSFVLVSSFPLSKKLVDMDATIEESGLTPNASLCMKTI